MHLNQRRVGGRLLEGLERDQGGAGKFGSPDGGQADFPYRETLEATDLSRQGVER